MPPIRPEDHAYHFRPAMLREIREQLKLTQAQMSDLLEIPVNTLSRWELGNNLPDANALAAIYAVAAERGLRPQFFEERKSAIMNRYSREVLVIQWDYQDLASDTEDIEDFCGELRKYIGLVFPRAKNFVAAAYTPSIHWLGETWKASRALRESEFDVKPLYFDANSELIAEGEKAFNLPPAINNRTIVVVSQWWSEWHSGVWLEAVHSGIDPKRTVYVLISNDGGYTDYLKRLQSAGIEVFVCGNGQPSEKLIKAVGPGPLHSDR